MSEPTNSLSGRDPNRIPLVLGAIGREWSKHPDLRLGQLLANAIERDDRLFGIEDDCLVRLLCPEITEQEREFIENEPARRSEGFARSMTFTSEAAARRFAGETRDV